MRKILLLSTFLAFGIMNSVAQDGSRTAGESVTTALPPPIEPIFLIIAINDVEAGTLADRVAAFNNLERVRITGDLNGDDINCIRTLANSSLVYLDISDCNIVEGGNGYNSGTTNTVTTYSRFSGGHIIFFQPTTSNNVIGAGMFASLGKLETIKLPNTVTTIESSALRDCPNLKQVTIGSAVSELSSCCVFSGCSNLTSVSFNDNSNYTVIDNIIYTADGQTVVTALPTVSGDITLPNTVTCIEPYAFYDLPDVTAVALPDNLVTIGAYAFYNTGIYLLTLPSTVTTIGNGAFWKCANLWKVEFPNDLQSMGYGAFAACNLTEIDLDNTRLTNILGNETSHSIGMYPGWSVSSVSTFEGNDNLTTVKLPSTLTSIGLHAFGDAALTDIYCYAVTPPSMYFVHYTPPVETSGDEFIPGTIIIGGGSSYTYSSSLTGVDTLTCRVHVPAVSLSGYRVAHGWRAFLSNMLTDLPDDIGYEPYTGSGDDLQDYLDSFGDTEDVLTETSYTREFRNTEWQSLYVPFTMSYEEWSPYFEVARLTEASTTHNQTTLEADMLTSDDGDVEANTAYLIRAKKRGTYTLPIDASQMATKVAGSVSIPIYLLGTGTMRAHFSNLSVTGNYNLQQDLKGMSWYCMMGGALWIPSSNSYTLPPFRWYAARRSLSLLSYPSHPISVRISGYATAIDEFVEVCSSVRSEGRMVYDMSGRRVAMDAATQLQSLSPGIYIVDGKKLIVR